MEKRSLTTLVMAAIIFGIGCGSALAEECATEIWVYQEYGRNEPDTNGTLDDPFKSITYALARAGSLGWPEPWCVRIGPGVYDADPNKTIAEGREIFPIEIKSKDRIILEGADFNDPNSHIVEPNSRIIDGRHLIEGRASLLYGDDVNDLQIRNLTFRNMNHFGGDGGAIELINCAGKIENCVIHDCNAQGGGGFYLSPRCCGAGVAFHFMGCKFINNEATGLGGGVYIASALNANISDCKFSDNTGGRGLYVSGTLTGNITGCLFSLNGGGGMYFGTLEGNISECNFTNNSASHGGGFQGGYLIGEINGCTFTENSASISGGGFYLAEITDGNVVNCSFKGNKAWSRDGGGFCISSILKGDVSRCQFDGNLAGREGGGFWCKNLTGNVGVCDFNDNSADSGGGFYVKYAMYGDVSECNFSYNEATSSQGGGFCVGSSQTGDVSVCRFTGNSATVYGGGFYCNTHEGRIGDCVFTSNCAGYTGGGCYVSTLIGDIIDCEYEQNSSGWDGWAVTIWTFDGKIESCIFTGHNSTAVQFNSDIDTLATVRSCLFVAPETLGNVPGWAVWTRQKTSISNNTMVGPGLNPSITPTAIYIEYETEAENGEILNNIIVDSDKAIHVDTVVDMNITYNQFYNIDEIICRGEQCLGNECWWLEWNLDNFRENCCHGDCDCDPLFVPDDPLYHIQKISTCVDAGDPTYVAEPNERDIDAQPRMADGSIDCGADEYYTYLLTADLYHDGIVNFLDYALLTSYWRQDEPFADIAPPGGDGIVDYLDLEVLVDEWLQTEPWY